MEHDGRAALTVSHGRVAPYDWSSLASSTQSASPLKSGKKTILSAGSYRLTF